MGYFIDTNGNYCEGDKASHLDIEVPQRPSPNHIWNGTVWVLSLQIAQTRQITKINASAQAALTALISSYPPEEVSTWPNQYTEAQAYTANPAALTPTLAAIATAAGLTVDQIAAVVLQKAAAYTTASGTIIGKRKLLTAQIQAANDVATVEGITW